MSKVLLADDSTHAQRMGSKILAGEGIEVVTVNNGEAAVKKLEADAFDLVMADVFMPGRTGYEVCDYIKSKAKFAATPVILIVGLLEPYDADQGKRVGADAVLRKPFESTAVTETVRRLLEASQKRRAESGAPATAPVPPAPAAAPTVEETEPITVPVQAPPPPKPTIEDTQPITVPFEMPSSAGESHPAAPTSSAPLEVPIDMGEFAIEMEAAAPIQVDHAAEAAESPKQDAPETIEAPAAEIAPEEFAPAEARGAEVPGVDAPGIEAPAEISLDTAPFGFVDVPEQTAETVQEAAFEALQADAEEIPLEERPVAQAAIARQAAAQATPAEPVSALPEEGGAVDFTAQLETMAAAASASAAPAATHAPAEPAAAPEPAAQHPRWVIEPETPLHSDAAAFAAATTLAPDTSQPAAEQAVPEAVELELEIPGTEATTSIAEQAPAVEQAPAQQEIVEELPAATEPVAEEAAPGETLVVESVIPAVEASVEAPSEARIVASTEVSDEAEVAPPSIEAAATTEPIQTELAEPTAETPAQEVPAEAAAGSESPDWAELLKTVEEERLVPPRVTVDVPAAPATQASVTVSAGEAIGEAVATPAATVPAVEAAAVAAIPDVEPATGKTAAASVAISAVALREAIEAGLNVALPGIITVPGLLDKVMGEIQRRFESVR